MEPATLLLIAVGPFTAVLLGYQALSGSPAARSAVRRLRVIRLRHSDHPVDRVEAQLRKAVAARRPLSHRAGATAPSMREALQLRLHRAGRNWSVRQYLQSSLGLAVLFAAVVFFKSGATIPALVAGVIAGVMLPRIVVGRLITRRMAAFTARFPDAIDLLVRGLRSGLPVSETFGLIATEVPRPVGEEFKLVTERIRIGKTMDEALQDTGHRLQIPEFDFFCIALAIQRETGGNLAETLSNLAEVLRKRAQMALKVRAMSSEAKASAMIIGALPFLVFILIYWMNPVYLDTFFTDRRLWIAGLGGMLWMAIGVAVMAKMIKFKF